MRVKAIQLGYYDNKRVREGQEFEIKSEKEFSHKWMVKLDSAAVASKKSKPKQEIVEDSDSDDVI